MSEFDPKYTFRDFAKYVRSERRWILDEKASRFLDAVRATSNSREIHLETGKQFWRSQIGSRPRQLTEGTGKKKMMVEEEWPYPKERMIPNATLVKAGRANPFGFACLYLATRLETAMAEMRPWVGESLSLAEFKVVRNLKLVNCRSEVEDLAERIFEKPTREKVDKFVWNDISKAFSRPVNQGDQEGAYVPTQILAEVFKAEGYDGIAYQSGLAKGANVVLFDIHSAEFIGSFLYNAVSVCYTFVADQFPVQGKKAGNFLVLNKIRSESP